MSRPPKCLAAYSFLFSHASAREESGATRPRPRLYRNYVPHPSMSGILPDVSFFQDVYKRQPAVIILLVNVVTAAFVRQISSAMSTRGRGPETRRKLSTSISFFRLASVRFALFTAFPHLGNIITFSLSTLV